MQQGLVIPDLHEFLATDLSMGALSRLEAHTGLRDTADLVHSALGVTAVSIALRKQGYQTYIACADGIPQAVSLSDVWRQFRQEDAQGFDTTSLAISLRPEAARAFSYMKNAKPLRGPTDHAVLGFALAFSAACIDTMAECRRGKPDISTRIFLSKTGNPHKAGIVLTGQPFDVKHGQSFDSARDAASREVRGYVKSSILTPARI